MKKQLLVKLKNGNTVYGTCILSVAPLWSKAASNAGLDFVFLGISNLSKKRKEIIPHHLPK